MKKFVYIVIITAGMTALFYYGILFFTATGEEEKKALRTGEVTTGALRVLVSSAGVVKPYIEVEVKSKAGGEIISFPFNEGDTLVRGKTAVRLDPTGEQSRVNQAAADLKKAEGMLEKARVVLTDTELKLDRKKRLFDKGVISRQEYDDAIIANKMQLTEITIASAELSKRTESLKDAEERLLDTRIKAPISGTILSKLVEEGQVISSTLSSASEGTPLFTMADLERLYVEAVVDEVDIGGVAPGQLVSITVDSWPSKVFKGTVGRISPKGRVERTVTVFDVVVGIDDADIKSLKPGMTANAEIETNFVKDALLVPAEAVKRVDGETGVYRVVGPVGGDVEWTEVKAGLTDGLKTVVLTGLAVGDRVVLGSVVGTTIKKKKKKRFIGH